ncbi:hypothetical protein UFOVP245_164 [uncultured Caudovirales phage]|uniref:Uncharacterized protein n=1 Tax=uncultured Caudovirales phage TaxID=2100421 RepID=A0A6J7X2G3_9CAUD|nr:hypothetical protein UFOVP245_164 [uncultured Caudovirales phage]
MKRIIILSLLLSGCASNPIKLIAPEYKVVSPPESLYNCPQLTKFDNHGTLTNEQVGQIILKLQKNNMTCKNSLDNIRSYVEQAKQTVEKK